MVIAPLYLNDLRAYIVSFYSHKIHALPIRIADNN